MTSQIPTDENGRARLGQHLAELIIRPVVREFLHATIPFMSPNIAWLGEIARATLSRGHLGPGPIVKALEESLKQSVFGEKEGEVILTTSGTLALSLALLGGNRSSLSAKGLTIIVPAYGVLAVPNAFTSVGAKVLFADIDNRTGGISLDSLRELWRLVKRAGVKVDALCDVHFSGARSARDGDKIRDFCSKEGLFLIEDMACGIDRLIGLAEANQPTRLRPAAVTTSFSVPKLVTSGQGGAVFLKSSEAARETRSLIDHGHGSRLSAGHLASIGTNLRMTDLQASLIQSQLEFLPIIKANREKQFLTLKRELSPRIRLFEPGEGHGIPLHNIIFCGKPREMINGLREVGIEARQQYSKFPDEPAYRSSAVHGMTYPAADRWLRQAVYLPFGTALRIDQMARIAQAVNGSIEYADQD